MTYKSESDSSISNFIIKKDKRWKPLSDLEWLEIFKPKKRDRNTGRGKDYRCLETHKRWNVPAQKGYEFVAFKK